MLQLPNLQHYIKTLQLWHRGKQVHITWLEQSPDYCKFEVLLEPRTLPKDYSIHEVNLRDAYLTAWRNRVPEQPQFKSASNAEVKTSVAVGIISEIGTNIHYGVAEFYPYRPRGHFFGNPQAPPFVGIKFYTVRHSEKTVGGDEFRYYRRLLSQVTIGDWSIWNPDETAQSSVRRISRNKYDTKTPPHIKLEIEESDEATTFYHDNQTTRERKILEVPTEIDVEELLQELLSDGWDEIHRKVTAFISFTKT